MAKTGKGTIVPTMLEAATKAEVRIHTLRQNISMIEGSGGNMTVLTGRDGKLLVDSGYMVSKSKVSAALSSLDANPVTQLLNSHWHADHTDGNAWVREAGASIIAHANTKKHLSVATRVEGWEWTFPAAPTGALPTTTFDDRHELKHNGTNITMQYYGPAHTDSDIYVFYEEANVLHVADTWWNGIFPFVDYSTGGSIDGFIRAMQRNVTLADENTIVVPGHGPIGGLPEMKEYLDMLTTIRGNVARSKEQGKSVDETIAEHPTAAYDAKFGQFLIDPAFFTVMVYQGV